MKISPIVIAATLLAGFAPAGQAQQGRPALERLYVIDCGQGHATDQSRWTTGYNAGKEVDFSDNCYLIKHAQGWMLWDTGLADSYTNPPSQPASFTWRRKTTLASDLEALGVKPADIKYVAISHTHGDHSGNAELFPQALLLVQKAEYDWPNQDGTARFKPEHPVKKLEGDYDVFGDGSVTVISTPGHTPGHQSLLVKLPKTGTVILTGDAVHFQESWDKRLVPGFNFDQDKSRASMQRLADLAAQNKALVWINHDKTISDAVKHAPDFYE